MDTNQAIQTLTSLSAQLRSNAAGYSAQADALDVALKQLQGTLNTEAVDIQEAVAQAAPQLDAPA